MEKKRVLVAMSGGVDSSAAALLLQQQGYACDGAMLKLYSGEVEGTCCSADDADDARSVAYRLGMKFYVFNETERFARDVMDHFVAEYCAGHTPNPCIDCNRCLKFGALLERALVLGYDYLATGHYARVGYDPETGLYRLLRGRDRRKDQSYVLYQLTQHQLSHLLLPVGEFDKPAIRESAREAGLLNADKADSQDICFVPDGDYGQGSPLLHHRPAEGTVRQRWETRLCGAEERCRQYHPAGGQRGALCTGADGLPGELDLRHGADGACRRHRQDPVQPDGGGGGGHTPAGGADAGGLPPAPAGHHLRTGRGALRRGYGAGRRRHRRSVKIFPDFREISVDKHRRICYIYSCLSSLSIWRRSSVG